MDVHLLRIALAKKDLSQMAIARALGVDHGTFSRWKRGWYSVPEKYRPQICKLLEVKEDELFPVEVRR